MLTKEQIMAADDRKTEIVNIPEWGGDIGIKTMSGTELDSYEASIVSGGKIDMKNIRARLVARTAIGDDGNRLFTDSEAIELGNKSCVPLDRLYTVASKLNKRSDKDQKELEKNSGAIQTDGSTSVLPLISE